MRIVQFRGCFFEIALMVQPTKESTRISRFASQQSLFTNIQNGLAYRRMRERDRYVTGLFVSPWMTTKAENDSDDFFFCLSAEVAED